MATLTIRPPKNGEPEQPKHELSQQFYKFDFGAVSIDPAMKDLDARRRLVGQRT